MTLILQDKGLLGHIHLTDDGDAEDHMEGLIQLRAG